MKIAKTAIPATSRLSGHAQHAYYCDTYAMPDENAPQSALECMLHSLSRTPGWIDTLMMLRNRIVAPFGLKDVGALSNIDPSKPASSYRVGDRVGVFSIAALDDHEVVLSDSDKHLDAQISFCKYQDDVPHVAITTLVHVHNLLGRAYLFFVIPMHKCVVPPVLRLSAAPPTITS